MSEDQTDRQNETVAKQGEPEPTAAVPGREVLSALGALGAIIGSGSTPAGASGEGGFDAGRVVAALNDNKVRRTDTVAAMLAMGGAPGLVLVEGYAVAGDGGGGIFFWDGASTATANGGTILPSANPGLTAGRWLRLYHGPINVLWFGAIAYPLKSAADSGSRSGSQIQAAIDAASYDYNASRTGGPAGALPGTGEVLIPTGWYRIEQNLRVRFPIRILGMGGDRSVIASALSFEAGFGWKFDGINAVLETYSRCDGAQMSHVLSAGNGTTAVDGAYVTGRIHFEACTFTSFAGCGVIIEGTAGEIVHSADFWTMRNCWATNNQKHGFYVHGSDAHFGVMLSCFTEENGDIGFHDSSFLGNTYIGCYAEGNGNCDYFSDGSVNRTLFLNCSAEVPPRRNILGPAGLAIGGGPGLKWNTDDPDCGAVYLGSSVTPLRVETNPPPGKPGAVPVRAYMGFGDGSGRTFAVSNVDANTDREHVYALRLMPDHFYWGVSVDGSDAALALTTLDHPSLGGNRLCAPDGFATFSDGFWQRHWASQYKPDSPSGIAVTITKLGTNTSIYCRKGWIVYNNEPNATQPYAGWMCTTSGSPSPFDATRVGTWTPFGRIEF